MNFTPLYLFAAAVGIFALGMLALRLIRQRREKTKAVARARQREINDRAWAARDDRR